MPIALFSNRDYLKNGIIQAACRNLERDWPPHRHEYYELELFLSGDGYDCIDGNQHRIQRGELYLMSPISFHSVHYDEPTKLINITFPIEMCDANVLAGLFSDKSYVNCHLSYNDISFIQVIANELIDCLPGAQGASDADIGYLRGLLDCILRKVRRLSANASEMQEISPIQYAMLYIQNHFMEPLKLSEVSHVINYSPNYFNTRFKEYTGVSFKQYLSDLRFTVAKQMLERTDMSVAQISSECGFRDTSNFSTGFKQKYGLSPKFYREKKQE